MLFSIVLPDLFEPEPNLYADRLRKSEWEVRPIDIASARKMVEALHYSGGASRTRVYLHGLFKREHLEMHGVAWWLPPTIAAARSVFPENPNGVLGLSRLVIAPGVPKNAATFLLAHSIRQIDKCRWPCLLTYADDWQNHTGRIYRAENWEFLGKTPPKPVYVDLFGRMNSKKIGPKTHTHQQMLDRGNTYIGSFRKSKFRKVIGCAILDRSA